MRLVLSRDDADRRVSVLLHMPVLLGATAAQGGGLLRVLLVFGSGVPAEAGASALSPTPLPLTKDPRMLTSLPLFKGAVGVVRFRGDGRHALADRSKGLRRGRAQTGR